MRLVYSNSNLAYLNLFRTLLASNGVDSEIRNEHMSSALGELPFFSVAAECWVADQDFDRAQTLLDEFLAPPADLEDRPCAHCQEINPGNFAICWQCQRALE